MLREFYFTHRYDPNRYHHSMVLIGYSKFPKVTGLGLHYQMPLSFISETLDLGRGSYPSAELLSAYSTVPADWSKYEKEKKKKKT